MIYGEHYIQHQAGVIYVSVCFYKEITFISKPEGWWGDIPRVLTVFRIERRKKAQHETLQKYIIMQFWNGLHYKSLTYLRINLNETK